jgi:nucleoside-diphosphate-sugar epimerase
MIKRIIRTVFRVFVAFFAVVYLAQFVLNLRAELPTEVRDSDPERYRTIAIFGATGTAGDGLLKAALADPGVERIYLVTRRLSPRIEEGIARGVVEAKIHMDYLDYSAVRGVLESVDTVYWAIGLSSLGLDQETYRRIHMEFPVRFVTEWMDARQGRDMSFHYISSNGVAVDSGTMWEREKALAEQALFEAASGSGLRVISYRPDYIRPTDEQSNIGYDLLYWFFEPVNSAVKAVEIGEAMLEVTAGGQQFGNGTIIDNKDIVGYSRFHRYRLAAGGD